MQDGKDLAAQERNAEIIQIWSFVYFFRKQISAMQGWAIQQVHFDVTIPRLGIVLVLFNFETRTIHYTPIISNISIVGR